MSRDLEYVGLTPGLLPAPGQQVDVRPVKGGREWNGDPAVRFEPPRGVSAVHAGTVIDGSVDAADIGAMMIDLSLRGYFRIGKDDKVPAAGKDTGWVFAQSPTPPTGDVLAPYEADFLNSIFPYGVTQTTLPELKQRLRGPVRHITDSLYRDVVAQGWYTKDPRRKGFLGVGGAARTAAGTAVRIQTLGFRKYIATAEAQQIKFEEAAGLFSRYLPYAMIFGLADRWAAVIGDVAKAAKLEGFGDILGGIAGDPFFWMFYGDDIAYLGVEAIGGLADLLGNAGGLFDLGDLAGGLGDVFGSIGDVLGDIGGDLFDW